MELYSSLLRLHHAGFLQESLYTRNMVVQPGPLWKHPSQRSKDTPSFRIIDFGRATSWSVIRSAASPEYDGMSISTLPESTRNHLMNKGIEWFSNVDYEKRKARSGTVINASEIWDC